MANRRLFNINPSRKSTLGDRENKKSTISIDPLGAVSPVLPIPPKGIYTLLDGLKGQKTLTFDSWNKLSPNKKSDYVWMALEAAKKLKQHRTKTKTKGNKGNMQNGNKKRRRWEGDIGSRKGDGTGYSLREPKPARIEMETEISPNTYVSDYMDAISNNCSPLHLSAALLEIPESSSYDLYSYFQRIISFDIQSKAQANVGFSLNVTNDFSADQILRAFNSLMYALQIYFYYASIITYHSNPANKNAGMIYLRSGIDATALESLSMLARRLMDTPCPPNLMKMIRYLSGTYLSGPLDNSPLIKLIPAPTSMSGLFVNGELEYAYEILTSTENNRIFSLMRRAIPHWIPANLDDVPDVPVYNDNFITLFANLPFTIYDRDITQVIGYPQVATADEYIQYNNFASRLDGAIFSLTGMFLGDKVATLPGLISIPFNDDVLQGDSRVSFYIVGDTPGFYQVRDESFLVLSRNETYKTRGDGSSVLIAVPHLPGAEKCLGVCITSVKETTYKTLDWLMSLDTIRKSSVIDRVKGRN